MVVHARSAAGAVAIAALAWCTVTPAAALAQDAKYPPTGGGGTTTTTKTPPTSTPSTLPFSGAEIATATAFGLGAAALGTVLVVAGRRRTGT